MDERERCARWDELVTELIEESDSSCCSSTRSEVVGGAAASSDDELPGASLRGFQHQLADPEGGRLAGSEASFSQWQARSRSHLDDGGFFVQPSVERVHGFAEEWPVDLNLNQLTADGTQVGFDATFASIGHG